MIAIARPGESELRGDNYHMEGKITYHQQVSYCGKPRCRKCQEGIGHGPYWYAYKTVNGHTTRTYIGKSLPPEIQAEVQEAMETVPSTDKISLPSQADFSAAQVRIFTLGHFQIERRIGQQWQTVNDTTWLRRSRVRALLALLLCSPARSVARSRAMEILCPTKNKETADHELNVALQSLRKILRLSRERQTQTTLLRSEGDLLVLADQQTIWVDADAFVSLVEQVPISSISANSAESALLDEGIEQSTDAVRISVLREALALYGGDFIPETQVPWVREQAQRLRSLWVALLLELSDLYMPTDTAAATDVLNRLLAYDSTNEAAVQRLMIVLSHLKRRVEALNVYRRLMETLRREYQTTPSPETNNLAEAIRQGQDYLPAPSAPLVAASITSALAKSPVMPTVEDTIGRSNQTPLVGRDRELATLRVLLQEARSEGRLQALGQRRSSGIPLDTLRRPQCVVLMGETGIGKTRLAEEISREARRGGWVVAWSRVYIQESAVPYRLWTELLRNLRNISIGLISSFYERSISEQVLLPSGGALPSIESLQPLVTLLPEFSEALPAPSARLSKQLTPEREQIRLWEAIRNLLIIICESAPLLVVLDDVQWADASSSELLGYLARSLYGYPIFFVATCRETELSGPGRSPHPLRSLIDHMLREHSVMTINVEPLSGEQIGKLVTGMSQLSESMVQYIQEHASGNPFFAEEMARTTPPTLPETVSAALEHRMSRLSEPCQRLLGNAAVLGGSFGFPLICAMEARSSQPDEDLILNLLEEALQAGVLNEEGTGTRITYHFWHPLLVSYLYENLSAVRRLRSHKRAAEILQQMYQGREEEVAATITHHLIRGDADSAQIAHYAELAANRAYVLSANAEAVQYFWLAAERLGLITRAEQGNMLFSMPYTQLAQLDTDTYAHHLSLLERLAECDMIRGNFTDARYLYELLLDWREQRPVYDPQYEAQIRALLWGEIGRTWRYAVNSDLAWQCCERGEQVLLAVGVNDGPAWTRLRLFRCNLYLQEGRYDEVHRVARELLDLFEQQAQTAYEQQVPLRRSAWTTRIQRILQGDPADLGFVHRILGDIAIYEGQLSAGFTHLSTALALYEQYGYKREIAHVACNLGYIHMKRAENELAQAEFRRAFSLAESIDDDPLISVIFSDRGEIAASQGNYQEAEEWYRKAMALLERTKDREYASRWNASLALVLQELGKEKEAMACAVRALLIGRVTHTHPCIGMALVSIGTLRMMQARGKKQASPAKFAHLWSHAYQDIQRALALEGVEAETRTTAQLVLAQLFLLSQDTEQARQQLNQAIESAQRYELVLLERRARALLSGL
jgi:DNA-binding SARP family transcriptional activator/tetratricopeptide (TPR) repeat protein